MFVDDDVILAAGCIERLVHGLCRRPGYAALAADDLEPVARSDFDPSRDFHLVCLAVRAGQAQFEAGYAPEAYAAFLVDVWTRTILTDPDEGQSLPPSGDSSRS